MADGSPHSRGERALQRQVIQRFTGHIAQSADRGGRKPASSQTIRRPAPVPEGQPRVEFELERRKCVPNLRGPGQRGAPKEEGPVRRASGELAVRSPLPGHRVRSHAQVHALQLIPEPQVLHDGIDG
jgi:hypothetical protein